MSLHFNQSEIPGSIENIFMAETRIEVVFNIEGSIPIVLPTSIYKCNYDSNWMAIYQPRPEILPSLKFDTMDISTLIIMELNRMARAGLRCRIDKFLNNYQISERMKENLILIEYFPPIRKVNLRSTYRLRTSYRYNVEATIQSGETSYACGTYFTVHDISVTGIGLLVPKRVGKRDNPFLKTRVGDILEIELKLERAESNERPLKISTPIDVARKVMSYNPASGFIGSRFSSLNLDDQEKLFQYIHDAQLYEIRHMKGVSADLE
jgi:hypothetical protein